MSRPAHILQPGPPQAERLVAIEARGLAFRMRLPAGRLLLEAVAEGFAEAGFAGGALNFGALALGPFGYVMPALSQTPEHAAYYSPTFRPAGVTRVEAGAMTLGARDGAPFFHCHALWREADGKLCGGHMLPEETFLAEPAEVDAFGLDGARFEATRDPETNFRLFEPVAAPARAAGALRRALAVRLRPNRDFAGALESLCAERGIRSARVRGGVGSTIGAAFADGRLAENFATEVFIRDGRIETGAEGPRAALDVGLVDYTGAIARGALARGANPVLMTFELALEELDRATEAAGRL